ncbi:hypothetical protein ABH15_03065 [Methanoculleus taiwanensis]|uniref:Integral membrane bound transporter domain-containing protein n=1 Tax=Methanoculleus taiwanensis TaxID=1550565 RepID=A0A498H5D5_9EURY|nr:FUSC family protein [Methanoculleus taiwanensis]RXE57120.1 hypothetical protein ABH15_03065 [Methanoculleus taiwanensis]
MRFPGRITAGTLTVAVQYVIVSLIAYLGAYSFTNLVHGSYASIGGLWAMISGMVVLQATMDATESTAGRRVFGSLVGAVLSAAYLLVFPFSPVGMALSIGITVLICQAFQVPDHARLAAITVGAIMIFSDLNPEIGPVVNAALRFGEVFIGSTVAVLVVRFWPFSPKDETRAE